ncbi:hypothetical protein Hanom_Chr10g00912471 [Helianthus anomalus]
MERFDVEKQDRLTSYIFPSQHSSGFKFLIKHTRDHTCYDYWNEIVTQMQRDLFLSWI